MLSRPVKTAYLSPRQPHHTCCNGTQYPGFRRPSSLRFVNKLDLIHCANRILISSGSPKAGYHGPSPGLSGWRLGGARHKLLGFTCWRRYFPLRSRAVTQNGLLVWQGVKGSRLHLPVEGKLESLEGKWGLMENTENRSERNPLPVSLLASSNSLFFFICLLFFCHCLPCWPGAGGGKSSCRGFLWWILSFHWLRRVTFFCMWSVKKSERLAVITHRCARTLFAASVSYLASSKNAFRFVPGDTGAPTLPSSLWTPVSERSSFFAISCSFWSRENYQSRTMDSFIFLYSLPLSTVPTHSCPLLILRSSPALLCLPTKGPTMPLNQGREVIIYNR